MNKELVIQTAKKMIEKDGLINLSKKRICDELNISDPEFTAVIGGSFERFVHGMGLLDIKTGGVPNIVRARTYPTLRKEHILKCALDLAIEIGYDKITREKIAEKAGVSMGLINKYFGTMLKFRRDIVRASIKQEILEIIAQAVINKDRHIAKAPDQLKTKAITTYLK